jgi:hypothetical protein
MDIKRKPHNKIYYAASFFNAKNAKTFHMLSNKIIYKGLYLKSAPA